MNTWKKINIGSVDNSLQCVQLVIQNDTNLKKQILANENSQTNQKSYIDIEYASLAKHKYDILSDENNCHKIIYSGDYLAEDILKSYNCATSTILDWVTWPKIVAQIHLDFFRMEIYYNYTKLTSIKSFHNVIAPFLLYRHPMTKTIYHLIMLFCTQATFYNQFDIIHNLYALPKFDIHVVQGKNSPRINIIYQNDTINIFFGKELEYTNISNMEKITNFFTVMDICIKLTDIPKRCGNIEYGIVTWTFGQHKILIV